MSAEQVAEVLVAHLIHRRGYTPERLLRLRRYCDRNPAVYKRLCIWAIDEELRIRAKVVAAIRSFEA